MSNRVSREISDGVCTLRLDRGDKLNALDTQAFEELDAHLEALERAKETVGCVVLRANGRAFCAGADLNAIGQAPMTPQFKSGVITRLARLPQPTIAAVHGICYTEGLELALGCDFIVADASARFADTHGKWGLVAAWGLIQRLPRRLGHPTAKRLMMTSKEVRAHEALEMGLIDLLANEGELDEVVAGLVAAILANSWHTNFAVKRLMLETDGMALSQAMAHVQDNYPGVAPDFQERLARYGRR